MNLENIANLPFFFIIGRTRSGTTLLRNLFDAHPNVAIPTEIPFIPFTYKKFGPIKIWEDNVINDFVNCISQFKKFQNLQISTDNLKTILQNERNLNPNFSYQIALKTIAVFFPSAFSKSKILIAGDKSPSYSMFPERIYSIFPEAKYVAIVRDYRDVVASVKKIDFELPFTSIICIKWKNAQRKILRLKKEHPNQIMLVKYEEFVTDSEHMLKDICKFLSIEYIPEVLQDFNQPIAMAKEFKYTQFDKHHISLKDSINTTHIEKWKQQLKPIDIRIADFFVGKWAELSGYKRIHKSFDLVAILYSIPALFLRLFIIILFLIINLLPFRVKGKYWAFGEYLAIAYYKIALIFNWKKKSVTKLKSAK